MPGAHTLTFGGNTSGPPTTALISPATFSGVAPGQAMSSVDADLLSGIANRTGTVPHPVTGATDAAVTIEDDAGVAGAIGTHAAAHRDR